MSLNTNQNVLKSPLPFTSVWKKYLLTHCDITLDSFRPWISQVLNREKPVNTKEGFPLSTLQQALYVVALVKIYPEVTWGIKVDSSLRGEFWQFVFVFFCGVCLLKKGVPSVWAGTSYRVSLLKSIEMSGGHLAFSYISNAGRFNLTKYRDTMYL